jgi:hypothetical protein
LADVLCSGSFMIDLIAPDLPRLGEPGDLVYAPRGIQIHVGGHAANVAIDLAQLGQSHVAAAGCIGDDVLGGFVEGALEDGGVEVHAERARGASTAKNVALVVEGEDRRFYAELAANTMLSPSTSSTPSKRPIPDSSTRGRWGGCGCWIGVSTRSWRGPWGWAASQSWTSSCPGKGAGGGSGSPCPSSMSCTATPSKARS